MEHKCLYLYGDGIGRVEYVQHMGDEMTIVNAARVSFGKHKEGVPDERDRKLVHYLLRSGHTSTLEHNLVTFRFVVPLFVRSQHHRHRTWSFNEISRRYTDENLEFYAPTHFRTQHDKNRQASNQYGVPELGGIGQEGYLAVLDQHCQASVMLYETLLAAGVAREMARMVLPQNLYTEYYGTVNLNNLMKFLVLRLDTHAQWEIRVVAQACRMIAQSLWPTVVGEYLSAIDTASDRWAYDSDRKLFVEAAPPSLSDPAGSSVVG